MSGCPSVTDSEVKKKFYAVCEMPKVVEEEPISLAAIREELQKAINREKEFVNKVKDFEKSSELGKESYRKSIANTLREADKIEQYQQILEIQEKLLEIQNRIIKLEEENKGLKEKLKVN